MAYSEFDLKKVEDDLGLEVVTVQDMFAGVVPVEPSAHLREWLAEFATVAIGFTSERGRGEAIIFPILAEAKRRAATAITVACSIALDVDEARGLTGVCDYLLSRANDMFYLRAPVFVVTGTKYEDTVPRLGRCAAEMVGVREFDAKQPLATVYGCSSSGGCWRFLKLEGDTLTIDWREYRLSDLPLILGILVRIADGVEPPIAT